MHTETAITLLISASKAAPFSATGHGAASQSATRVINGHLVTSTARGEQVRLYINGSSKPVTRDDAYDVLTGAVTLDSVPATYFHGA